MNKPNITKGKWFDFGEMEDKYFAVCNEQRESIALKIKTPSDSKAISAVPEMIDALIECHELIKVQHKFENDENMYSVLSHNINNIEKALKKAGVTGI